MCFYNSQSHGTLTVRYGALVFGLVSFAYFLMYLVKHWNTNDPNAPEGCVRKFKGINYLMMTIFAALQALVVFTFPRLNLLSFRLINRLST